MKCFDLSLNIFPSGRTFLSFLLLSILFSPAAAQDTIVAPEKEILNISGEIFLFVDESGRLAYEDIQKPEIQSQFKKSGSGHPNLGITRGAVWCRFILKKNSNEKYLVEIGDATIDSVSLYYQKGDKLIHKISGDRIDFYTKEFPSNLFIFSLDLEPGASRTYYARLKNEEGLQFTFKTGSYHAYIGYSQKTDLAEGIYLGFLAMIVLYNFCLFLAVRDSVYLYYLIYALTLAAANMFIKGYDLLLFGNQGGWLHAYPTFIYTLASITAIVFTIQFLKTSRNHPILHKGLWILLTLHLLPPSFNLLGDLYTAFAIFETLIFISALYLYTTAILIYRRGYKPAKFYIYAWSAFIAGIIITVLKDAQVVPANGFTVHALQIGSSLEVLLLSFALADRINVYKDQKRRAQELALQAARESSTIVLQQNRFLETRVKERTQELEEKNDTLKKQQEELQQLNKVKDKFFSILSHDIRGPLNSLHGIINLMKKKELSREEMIFFIDELSNTLATTRNLVDNILQWAISEIKENKTAYSDMDLRQAGMETIEILKHAAKHKQISIHNQLADGLRITTDPNMVRLVLRNLISNAIKFTPEKGNITLSSEFKENQVWITVSDTGIGISRENQEKVFSPLSNYSTKGTANEKGTGIGLVLCKEFLEKNQEKIWVTSEEGKGTRFTFTLSNKHPIPASEE